MCNEDPGSHPYILEEATEELLGQDGRDGSGIFERKSYIWIFLGPEVRSFIELPSLLHCDVALKPSPSHKHQGDQQVPPELSGGNDCLVRMAVQFLVSVCVFRAGDKTIRLSELYPAGSAVESTSGARVPGQSAPVRC